MLNEEKDGVVEETTHEVEGAETGDEKPKLSPEKIKGIKQRQFTKLAKELGIDVKGSETAKEPSQSKKGFDYGEKAFLKASGIQNDEHDFVYEVMQSTGKTLDEVLEAKYFQNELKERREAKATKEAIPSGSKRSASNARDTVEYWLAKGELPPYDQRELRHQVVQAKIKKAKQAEKFSSNPIIR